MIACATNCYANALSLLSHEDCHRYCTVQALTPAVSHGNFFIISLYLRFVCFRLNWQLSSLPAFLCAFGEHLHLTASNTHTHTAVVITSRSNWEPLSRSFSCFTPEGGKVVVRFDRPCPCCFWPPPSTTITCL